MIEVSDLSFGYSSRNVLSDIHFTASAGQITVIIGPNGCGKSTLLKMLCGILVPRSGEIRIHGRGIAEYNTKLLAQQVAYLAQSRPIPDISVERMVLHGRFPYLNYPRRYRIQDFQIARSAMERMGILDLAETALPALSGGIRQKVYIAMALAQDTPIILFDEPTTYLDVSHQLRIMAYARDLCREGKTVVMVLHDLSMALQMADHLIVMNRGRIVVQGSPEEIFLSGHLTDVFGIEIRRIWVENSWQYYYKEREEVR